MLFFGVGQIDQESVLLSLLRQLRAEGVDIAIISRQLGHSSITTTARYLDHIAPTAVIEAMRRRSWTGA